MAGQVQAEWRGRGGVRDRARQECSRRIRYETDAVFRLWQAMGLDGTAYDPREQIKEDDWERVRRVKR